MEKLKNNLHKLLSETDKTRKAISEELDINPRTLSRWEKGNTAIPSDKARKLAELFGVSLQYLLGYSEDKKDIYRSTLDTVNSIDGEYINLENFVTLFDIARYKTVDVRDKILLNLKKYYDYDGERMREDFPIEDMDKFSAFLEKHQESADEHQAMLLIGIMNLRDDMRFTILDLLSLEGERLETVKSLIEIVADNPLHNRD